MNKPNGLTVIDYRNVHDILMGLDIGDFPGVGKASKQKCIKKRFIQDRIYIIKVNGTLLDYLVSVDMACTIKRGDRS